MCGVVFSFFDDHYLGRLLPIALLWSREHRGRHLCSFFVPFLFLLGSWLILHCGVCLIEITSGVSTAERMCMRVRLCDVQ